MYLCFDDLIKLRENLQISDTNGFCIQSLIMMAFKESFLNLKPICNF